jgi:uncharacterized membrane protein
MLAQAPVWHFWIAVFIVIPALLLVVATIIGYLVKVVAPRYSRRS